MKAGVIGWAGLMLLLVSLNPVIADHSRSKSHPPLGLPKLNVSDRKQLQQKIALGRDLFFDVRLSRDGSVSCGSCHQPAQAFTQNDRTTSSGIKGRRNRRNTPTLLNVAYYKRFHVDGRETSLHTQFLLPLTDPSEMASRSVGYVITKLGWISDYPKRFSSIYGRAMSVDTVGDALAAYQETLVSANSRFDRWYYGEEKSLFTEQERLGFKLFTGKAKCSSCHTVADDHALFTDQGFHDIGFGWLRNRFKRGRERDQGRFEVTGDPRDKWRYRTPSLRNIGLTGPYMHDGSLSTLEEVLRFYNKGGSPHPGQDERIEPLNLSDADILALKAFLLTLTGDNLEHLIRFGRGK